MYSRRRAAHIQTADVIDPGSNGGDGPAAITFEGDGHHWSTTWTRRQADCNVFTTVSVEVVALNQKTAVATSRSVRLNILAAAVRHRRKATFWKVSLQSLTETLGDLAATRVARGLCRDSREQRQCEQRT
jgi:hypothetical protein